MSHRIPRKSPAYIVIADELRSWIERGDYGPGDKLPNERELVERFGVARMTVRHALDTLQIEGLIDRRRGRTGGTFIRDVPTSVELACTQEVPTQLAARGMEVRTRVLNASVIVATARIAQALGLEREESVNLVSRVVSVEGVPLTIERVYIPYSLAPDLVDLELDGSLVQLLDTRYNCAPTRKSEFIAPAVGTEWEQQHLESPCNLPMLRLTTTMEAADGRKVLYSETVLRCDLIRAEIRTGYDSPSLAEVEAI